MSVDFCFTPNSFFLSFFLSFRRLISELAEWNSTKIGHMVGSKYSLKTHAQNLDIPSPYKWVPKTTFLGRFRNLSATWTAYVFGMKHNIDNRPSALTTNMDLLHRPKMSYTLVHKRVQTGPPFLPTLCKFCLCHCQASQTEISKRNSAKLCQTANGKSR